MLTWHGVNTYNVQSYALERTGSQFCKRVYKASGCEGGEGRLNTDSMTTYVGFERPAMADGRQSWTDVAPRAYVGFAVWRVGLRLCC